MDKKKIPSAKNDFYAPVVTLLGHVDHGKTSILDAIRKTSVAEGEHGGITQKIGAHQIEVPQDNLVRKITFIDTPGHEAFAQMRHRGGRVADIGLLIVSSTEGIMPQTKESIKILKESKIPFIVVLTKSDLPDKNPEKVKGQLAAEDLKLEEYGGNIPVIEVSAKTGTNIKELLELILLVWEMQDKSSKISSTAPLEAIVIESKLDKNSGPRATIVVKNGKIEEREEIFCQTGQGGGIKCKVKSITDTKGQRQKEANIGDAVEILGFEKVPPVGGIVTKEISNIKSQISNVDKKITPVQEQPNASQFLNNREEEEKKLSVILSADTFGSLEAIMNALPKDINVALSKTGEITTNDISFAKSIGAIVIGFNVKILPDAQKLAATEKILFRNYQLIYELTDELTDASEGKKLSYEEEILGIAKIKASFPFEKTKVLGVEVTEGRIARGDKIRILRADVVVGESTISSLRQGKDQTSKIEEGKEAGVILSPFVDFNIGDMLISHS